MEIEWIKIIKDVLGGSNLSNIVKIIVLIFGGIATIFVSYQIKKLKEKAARAETIRRRQQHQEDIEDETRETGRDAQNSEDRIEDIINEGRN